VIMSKGSLENQLTAMLSELASVETLQKLGHVSFLIKGKVFAFTRPQGVVLKLPTNRVADLVKSSPATVLVMGKRKMKEWVVMEYADSKKVNRDLPLFKEALLFVSGQ